MCSGDAGVSPQESAESSVRSVCGRPEALQLRQSAARPGLSAITQHALQLPRQELAARLTVTLIHTDSGDAVSRYDMNPVCVYAQGGVGVATEARCGRSLWEWQSGGRG